MTHPLEPERLHVLREGEAREGRWVLYWMQSAVRAEQNPALDHAIARANDLGLPVLAAFALTDAYPEAGARHYAFLLDGLRAARDGLRRRNVPLVVRRGTPQEVIAKLAADAAEIVVDMGWLRHQLAWREALLDATDGPVTGVEGDVVVPTGTASGKREWAARTLRPRITRHLDRFLAPHDPQTLRSSAPQPAPEGEALDDDLLDRLAVDRSVAPVPRHFRGGTDRAKGVLSAFVRDRLPAYDDDRNQPQRTTVSHLAMYLNYGQISPLTVACAVRDSGAPAQHVDSFLEEVIVRRELGHNYVRFEPAYDRYDALPDWALRTLDEHRGDAREFTYDEDELTQGRTHDPYWNAAMDEMRITGYMHNYMRMYWGKKILEWTPSPEAAFKTLLAINNRWSLDGRVPPSFANVAWVFGLHDRAWTERPVFGKIRYMNAKGLKRKADPDAYVERIEALTGVAVHRGEAA
jgi:deoxyribodipyrimidine photo-lyase